jgi:hypothetical protein
MKAKAMRLVTDEQKKIDAAGSLLKEAVEKV